MSYFNHGVEEDFEKHKRENAHSQDYSQLIDITARPKKPHFEKDNFMQESRYYKTNYSRAGEKRGGMRE